MGKALRLRWKPQKTQNAIASLVGISFLALLAYASHVFIEGQDYKFTQRLLAASTLETDPATLDRLWTLARASTSSGDFTERLQHAGLIPKETIEEEEDVKKPVTTKTVEHVFTNPKEQRPTQEQRPTLQKKKSGPVPTLSKELAIAHSRDNVILVTWANLHFAEFALNWASHVQSHGISNYLVGAMDVETADILVAAGVNVFAMYDAGSNSTGLSTNDFGWGTETFHKMGRQKVDLAAAFLSYGVDLCLCDTDTVWINDPTDYFAALPEVDILASSDALRSHLPPGDTGLEMPEAIHASMNIGLLFFKHSKNTTAFARAWSDMLEADDKIWDQAAFNELGHEGLVPFQLHKDNERVVWGWNHSVAIGILPVATFASGNTFFVQKLFEVQKVSPFAVHATFQYGGTPGKRHRMREAMLWKDAQQYYSEGRFLSFDLTPPKIPDNYNAWEDTDAMIDHHLASMRSQLQEVRDGMAVAVALNRTLIMPKLMCFCDRYWAPVEQCRVPGAIQLRLPFVCPLDHIMVPMHFTDHPVYPAHPPVEFREYSFLSNPRTPAALLAQAVHVEASPSATTPPKMSEDSGKRVLTVPSQQNDEQLRKILEPYKDVQLLTLMSVKGIIKGFADDNSRDGFMARFRHTLDFWCCRKVKEGEDGGWAYARDFGEPW